MIIVNTDGTSRGNIGPASIGVLICKNGEELVRISKRVGTQTNNIAEYMAVLEALNKIIELKLEKEKIILSLDSELIVKQLNTEWNARNLDLKTILNKILNIVKENNLDISFVWIKRNENKEAHKLANKAFISKINKIDTLFPINKKGYVFPKLNNGVLEKINDLNQMHVEELNYNSIIQIKTNGVDEYSDIFDKNKLLELIFSRGFNNDDIKLIFEELKINLRINRFYNEIKKEDFKKIKLNLGKWICRGLKPSISIRKAIVDFEINLNKEKSETKKFDKKVLFTI